MSSRAGQPASRLCGRRAQQRGGRRFGRVSQMQGRGPELAVLEEAAEKLVPSLFRRQFGLEFRESLGEQQAGFHLHQQAHEDQELGHLVPVLGGGARFRRLQIGQDDVEERDLQEVDLLLEDQGQQQVERPLVDVQIEFQRSQRGLTRWCQGRGITLASFRTSGSNRSRRVRGRGKAHCSRRSSGRPEPSC